MVIAAIWSLSIGLMVLALYVRRVRTASSLLSAVLLIVCLGLYAWSAFRPLSLIVLMAGVYQVLNLARLYKAQMHEKYLLGVVLRTGFVLYVCMLYANMFDWFVRETAYSVATWLWALGAVQLLVVLVLLYTEVKTLVRSTARSLDNFTSDSKLPTVSVLIPARNEDAVLEECLRTVLANDYSKLEIIVLDDCSQDRRVADVVKQFAHDGVRFIPGDMPKVNWLAKNQAYETLSNAASGEWLLFMGVDVRLTSTSIRAMVNQALHTNKKMLSVLPERLGGSFMAGFASTLRYTWQLALPRRLFGFPPVLSTIWLIERKGFFAHGGMPAVARTVIPEGYFARELYKTHEYGFVRSNDFLRVETMKSLHEQYQTSIRTLYPSIRRQPEGVFLASLGMLAFGILPFALCAYSYLAHSPTRLLCSAIVMLLTSLHFIIVSATNPRGSLFALFNLPYAICQELYLLNLSMWRYEFGEVNWKGRNICAPVMHVVPHLPEPTHINR